MKDVIKYTRKDHLLNIILVLFFIMPQNMVFYLFVPISMIFIFDKNKKKGSQMQFWIYATIITLVFSFLFNVLQPWFVQKNLLKAIQLAILLFTFGRIKSFKIIKGYLIFLLGYLAIFQFAYQLNIPVIGDIMNIIYPLSDEELAHYSFTKEMSLSDIGGYTSRLGGIYYNPNNCAFFLEALLLVFLQERKQFKVWSFSVSIIVLLACILSTGSRTSFLVLVLIAAFSLTEFKSQSIVVVGLFVFAFWFVSSRLGSDVRIFQVNQGLDDSFGTKVAILLSYLTVHDSIISLFFGTFGTSSLPYILGGNAFAGTDFEIGDVVVSYGFVGLFCLIMILVRLFFLLGKNYRVFYCILLWCFSNTVFMSYRASSVFLLILSIYYLRTREEKKMLKVGEEKTVIA